VSEHDGTRAGDDDAGASGPEEPQPLQKALDLFVFAPVGLALTAVEDLPALIAKGRQRFETDVRNARVIGEFVVTHGQRDVVQRVGKLLGHGESSTEDGPSGHEAPAAREPEPAGTIAAVADAAEPATAAAAAAAQAPTAPTKPAADPADGAVVERALAGYDTLSASQVVRRLESLGPDELRAVHRHEASHRHRRTILNRAQQLLDGNATPPPAGGGPENEQTVE
jgi:hypothetical protein